MMPALSSLLAYAALAAAGPVLLPRTVTSLDQAATEEAQQRDDTATRAFSKVQIKTSDGRCLFVDPLSGDFRENLTPVQVAVCDGTDGQGWDVITSGRHNDVPGAMLIVSSLTNACLNFDPRRAAGNQVLLFSCGGRADGGGEVTDSQLFAFDGGAGPLPLQPENAQGSCFTVKGDVLDVANCDDADADQSFTVGDVVERNDGVTLEHKRDSVDESGANESGADESGADESGVDGESGETESDDRDYGGDAQDEETEGNNETESDGETKSASENQSAGDEQSDRGAENGDAQSGGQNESSNEEEAGSEAETYEAQAPGTESGGEAESSEDRGGQDGSPGDESDEAMGGGVNESDDTDDVQAATQSEAGAATTTADKTPSQPSESALDAGQPDVTEASSSDAEQATETGRDGSEGKSRTELKASTAAPSIPANATFAPSNATATISNKASATSQTTSASGIATSGRVSAIANPTAAVPVSRAGGTLQPSAAAQANARDETATRAFASVEIRAPNGQCMFVDPTAGDFRQNLIPVALVDCSGTPNERWDVVTAGRHNDGKTPESALIVSSLTNGCISFDGRRQPGDTVTVFSCGGRADGEGDTNSGQLMRFIGALSFAFAPRSEGNATCILPGEGRLDSGPCPTDGAQLFSIFP